jgi:flagellar protein FliL
MAAADASETKKGPSLVVQMAVFAVISAAAVGTGWLVGSMMSGSIKLAPDHPPAANIVETTTSEVGDITIVHLEPITTTLAAPASMWARLEVSLVFDGAASGAVAEAVHQDLLAYLRTVKSHQIEGPSGYQHFRADLVERADIRSAGTVRDILVRTLILE